MKLIQYIAKQSVWYKLACVAALLTTLSPAFLLYEHFEEPFFMWPAIAVKAIHVLVLVPGLFLTAFALWHWRTRYSGHNSFAWLLFFVCYAFFFPYLAFFLPALTYFGMHAVPDMLSRGAYRSTTSDSVPCTRPKTYQYVRSILLVSGLLLLTWGFMGVIGILIGHTVMFDIYYSCLAHKVGKPLTQSEANAIWIAAKVGIVNVRLLVCLSFVIALGCVLVLVSQRLRWRLLDDEQKDELKKRSGI